MKHPLERDTLTPVSAPDTLAMVRHLVEMGAAEIELHPDGSLYRVRFGPRVQPQVHPIAAKLDENVRRTEAKISADEEIRKLHERVQFAATEGVR